MKKALALYSDRQTPDYANSIKESISAVESMLAHIIGKEATLSGNLKELDKLGLDLHPAFKDALGKLYGFTSDSSGIRHGGYSEPLQLSVSYTHLARARRQSRKCHDVLRPGEGGLQRLSLIHIF